VATYKIHPGIGIARLGNSDTEFYLAPETPAGLPQACDQMGNPSYQADGIAPVLVTNFKDAQGRIKRQAARFQIFVYDDASPEGRPLKTGDPIEGGGNEGVLVDIQWQVYVANKKACWYQFDTTQGEHGYPDGYPRRNADVTDRDRLIIDPGPRIVNGTTKRRASFDRSGEGSYATTFPPEDTTPFSIDTLGEMKTDDSGRLIVLGGHGCSGSEKSGPGEPHITEYANNDGWYDDVSDGPVMARLVMFSKNVGRMRYVDVEYPAWVIVGYPRYVPVVLDMVTMDEVLYDLSVREFADDTALFGQAGTFDDPPQVDFHNENALRQWKDSRLTWNRAFRPWFYRDIWPILYRPDQFRFLCNVLGQSNFPHDQQQRGMFDPDKLSKTPKPVIAKVAAAAEKEGLPRPRSIEMAPEEGPPPKRVVHDKHGQPFDDEYGAMRQYLFGLLRLAGEENEFKVEDRISSRLHNLPLMPLLCGDNCLTNIAPSKFLRLTDYQLFILKQWADGRFINEIEEGWPQCPPYNPYVPYPTTPPKTGRELDRGVLSNALGGAFSPGAEVGWIMRNPSIYWAPYRVKADRSISNFLETAAQMNTGTGVAQDYTFNVENPLSQDNDFDTGLQPGDMTKYMALPWQTDFNECTTNPNDVTYADWNVLYPESEHDSRMQKERKVVETMWWPAHRPLQYNQVTSVSQGKASYAWLNWSRGIPQMNQGDLKMVTEWSSLRFIIRNPYLPPGADQTAPSDLDNDPRYCSIEGLQQS
jgi:L-Lysine epsilon oxidase N-terminal/L-lysine epsilon oxidase C-terminal domain